MKTFAFLLYFYAIYVFPFIWLKVVNIYRISAEVRAKLLTFVVTDKFATKNYANFFYRLHRHCKSRALIFWVLMFSKV